MKEKRPREQVNGLLDRYIVTLRPWTIVFENESNENESFVSNS